MVLHHTFPIGFWPIFSGGKHGSFRGQTLASLVTPRWSRWVLHSQQVRRGWEQFWAPSTLVLGTDTLDTYPTWGKRNMIFNSSFLRDRIVSRSVVFSLRHTAIDSLTFFGFDLYIYLHPCPIQCFKASKPLHGLFGWVTLLISKKIHVLF